MRRAFTSNLLPLCGASMGAVRSIQLIELVGNRHCIRFHPAPCPPMQLPETVSQTYTRGKEMAAEKDAEGVVCVPASQVKEGEAGQPTAHIGGWAGRPASGCSAIRSNKLGAP